MKFKALPVTDLTDVTLDFEQLAPKVPATGSVAISWSASATATVTINHGLGHTPTWFSLSLLLSGQTAYLQATSVTATSIAVTGTAAASFTGSGTVFWAAT